MMSAALMLVLVGRGNVATKTSFGLGSDLGQGRPGHGEGAIDRYHRGLHEVVITLYAQSRTGELVHVYSQP